jgi:hypothetical protein
MISKMDILTIISPKILNRISLILIIFINTNFQHKEGSFDSVIGHSRVLYCYSNDSPFRVMSYLIPRLSRKTPVFVLTVQWVANPLVPIRYNVYRIVLFTCVLKIVE